MFKKQQASHYNKYYHNDIKKQLGIDESRTASQKLLDRVIKVDKRADFYQNYGEENHELKSQPKKKVKTNSEGIQGGQKVLSNMQILQSKLLKNIQNQQNITKLLKSLSILRKCLNQESFINDSQINFKQNWRIYSSRLIAQINERNYCSGESFNIMQNIGDCLHILFQKFGKQGQLKKVSEQNSQYEQQKEKNDDKSSKNEQLRSEIELYIIFSRLFTDDSFVFNSNLMQIKKHIFSALELTSNSSKQDKQQALKLINKLVLLSVKFQWAHSSLVNFFRQFNNLGYQNQFVNQEERRNYLKKYNQFLNRKPKLSGQTSSYSIMGSSKNSTGVKTVHLQSANQEGGDKWVNKQ